MSPIGAGSGQSASIPPSGLQGSPRPPPHPANDLRTPRRSYTRGHLASSATRFRLHTRSAAEADSALRRELHFFTLYRLLEAALLALLLFGPLGDLVAEPRHDLLARAAAISYLFIAAVLFVLRGRSDLRTQALVGVSCDLFFGLIAIHAMPGAGTGIALMLLFNVGAAALAAAAAPGPGSRRGGGDGPDRRVRVVRGASRTTPRAASASR